MKSFAFTLHFRFDSKEWHQTSFNSQLSDKEVAFVKQFLKENGDTPYWAFEFDCPAMFERLMEAHMNAIIKYVNKEIIPKYQKPLTKRSIDWEYVPCTFNWPKSIFEA